MSTKISRLGTPPPIEETLDTLHKVEAEMVKQHIKENPSIIEQSGVIFERPVVEGHEPGPATPGGDVNPATSPAKRKSPKSGPRSSAKKEDEKIPLKQFNISIPEDLFFWVKGYSLEQRKSLQAVGIEILNDFRKRKLNKK